MASYSDSEPPRARRARRSRYDDDNDSDYDYAPSRREPRRPRPQPNEPEDPPVKPTRRRSILVDPDETGSQRERRRRVRSNSRVRLRTSSDEESDYRRVGRGSRDPRASRRDLERKTSQDNIKFREKRDGYGSDEGETLKRSRSAREPNRSRRNPYDEGPYDDDYDPKAYKGDALRPPRAGAADATLPLRGKRRDPAEPPVSYGTAPIPDGPPEHISKAHSRTADYARDTMPARYEKSRENEAPYVSAPPPYAREEPPTHRRYPDNYDARGYDDRGYRSDGPSRQRRDKYNRDDYADRYDRRQKEDSYRSGGERNAPRPRYDDYYSDHRDDRARRYDDRARRDRRDKYRDTDHDGRDRYRNSDHRRSHYDDRDRERDRDRDRDRSRRRKGPEWQKEAGALFMAHAMPVIRKEGTKFVKDQMQKYLARRAATQPM